MPGRSLSDDMRREVLSRQTGARGYGALDGLLYPVRDPFTR
jgi:hypothetical protein